MLTALIHLGYLGYDWREDECYIPNKEVGGEMAQYADRPASPLGTSKNLLLVGISYNRKTKTHDCRIEKK